MHVMFLGVVEVWVIAEARVDLNNVEAVVAADAGPVEGDVEEVAIVRRVLIDFNEVVVAMVDRDLIQRCTNVVDVHSTIVFDETTHDPQSLADELRHADL